MKVKTILGSLIAITLMLMFLQTVVILDQAGQTFATFFQKVDISALVDPASVWREATAKVIAERGPSSIAMLSVTSGLLWALIIALFVLVIIQDWRKANYATPKCSKYQTGGEFEIGKRSDRIHRF